MDWTVGRFILACVLSCICMTAAVEDFLWLLSAEGIETDDVRAEFGESATLKCVLMKPKETLNKTFVQLTWKKIRKGEETKLATYRKDTGVRVEKAYENLLNVSISGSNKTVITVYKTSLEDEGCYVCVFNFFPQGAIEGKVCLVISGEVLIEKSHKVRLGYATTLKCYLRNPVNVTQVSWEKNGQTIGIYRSGITKIEPQFQKMVNLNMESPHVSALTIHKAALGDEGVYKCVFNSFPKGSTDGRTKLQVHSIANCLQPEMIVMTLTLLSFLLWLYW
ncbi:PREDICTED: OX-2 membrane glycoprotein-like [Nanorana parkeri]|uniref:OX-2 membrane glycoprotein-like n=1 Tax=Nanorana parkeri TaxID=125878 RepID=UPI000854B944|nr:PREDICTED: OX-2 membrane glycoprotein-like [Nanorana parkeri]